MQTLNASVTVNVAIPGFACGALSDKAREYADHFNHEGKHEAAEAWYAVAEALHKGHCSYNLVKEA